MNMKEMVGLSKEELFTMLKNKIDELINYNGENVKSLTIEIDDIWKALKKQYRRQARRKKREQ